MLPSEDEYRYLSRVVFSRGGGSLLWILGVPFLVLKMLFFDWGHGRQLNSMYQRVWLTGHLDARAGLGISSTAALKVYTSKLAPSFSTATYTNLKKWVN